MGSYAPDEVVAQVRALALQGYRPHSIAEQTDVPRETVRRWLHEWAELGSEEDREIFNQERRVALMAGQLLQLKYESALDNPDSVKLTEAAIGFGITRSKLHERAQRQNPGGPSVNIVIALAGSVKAQSTSREIEPRTEIELDGAVLQTKDSE